jgi:NhaP-type Na+/H+ or K+/H+ antiporter
LYQILAILAIFALLYSATAGRLDQTPVNGALVFTAFGVLMGPDFTGWLPITLEAEGLKVLAELTLALVLFIDASNANLSVVRANIRIPRLLLLGGLPLTIVLGTLVGLLLLDGLSWVEVALLATMLAPTDAALGKAVVTNPAVPARIREGLNVESGLNDGICVPILLVFLAMATGGHADGGSGRLALHLVLEEIGVGLAVGLGLTWLAFIMLRACKRRGWVTDVWRQIPVVALAMACFGVAQWVGGSGFIAAFAGGLLFGHLAGDRTHSLVLAAEGASETMALLTWVAFGAAAVGSRILEPAWQPIAYALLSLTVIRMLPVFLALTPTDLGPGDKLFVGWFGPRGLASIVFGVMVINADLPGGELLEDTVVWTVLLSVIAHGLSANPLVAALFGTGRRAEDAPVS